MQYPLTALLVWSLLLPAATIPRASNHLPDVSPIAQALADVRAQYRIPGLAATVLLDGEVVWSGNWGNLTTKTPRDIASITKTMAAVLAMQEAAGKRLNLQDPVAGLPNVEVRHLLSHTSVGNPGESFHYNNVRYGALTSIIERASREPFGRLLRERIFRVAGMASTQPGKNAISGVVSNAEDLGRYLAALDGEDLLGEREKQWMWMPIGPGLPYALGWYSQSAGGRRVVWHYGQLTGYGSSLVVKVPALRANVVVLANSSLFADAAQFDSGDLTRSALGRAILQCLAEAPSPEIAPLVERGTITAAEGLFAPKRAVVHGAGF